MDMRHPQWQTRQVSPETLFEPADGDEIDRLLKMAKPKYLDESQAPPVDLARLQALAFGELDDQSARFVHELCTSYRSWDEAYNRVLSEAMKREAGDGHSATNL